ncbi:MAG: DctP family TRAP transporter solute-binding subunit [candidate division NC10 bacterium]|nr:DctP family TRAP transporter solute-binding subunit [candidate division NC10 bacterium]
MHTGNRWAVAGAVLALVAGTAGFTEAASPIVIKFSHVVAKEAPKGKATDRFAELVNQRLKGRVEIQVFHNSSLYKDREEIEALQLGAVQLLAPSTAKLVPWFPQYQVFDLPYLFADQEHAYRSMTDPRVTAKLFPLLKSRGMLGLAAWDNGFKHMTSNKCPIVKPEDMKGQKIRVQSSKVLEEQFRTVGANPKVMAFGEVYNALERGVVDGEENTFTNKFSQKMHEVQKCLTVSNHGYIAYVVLTNALFWEGLPKDIRKVLEGSLAEVTKWQWELSAKEQEEAFKKMQEYATATGKLQITVLTPEQRKQWAAAFQPVHKKFESAIGKDLLDLVYSLAK